MQDIFPPPVDATPSFPDEDPSGEVSVASSIPTSGESVALVWVRRYVYGLAIVVLGLMALGSATRVMNAGLACPDWPLCYGTLVPSDQMNLQVFLEWFHRVVATSVGFCAIALVATTVWQRSTLPRWLPWASFGALCLVIVQGILGGLTVTELLRFDIVTAHLGTGLLFFCTLLAIAIGLTPLPVTLKNKSASHQPAEMSDAVAPYLPVLGAIATVTVYGQSILGALVASQWALHMCLGGDQLCGVMNAHLFGVVPASLTSLSVAIATWMSARKTPLLLMLSRCVGVILLAQLFVGTATFRLHLQVEPLTVTHQAIGAALLGTLLAYTLVAWKQRSQTLAVSQVSAQPVSFSASPKA